VEGTVVVELTFNSDGRITDSHVLSGPDELRASALESALRANYSVSIARTLQVLVDFRLANARAVGQRGGAGNVASVPPPAPPPPTPFAPVFVNNSNAIVEAIDIRGLSDPQLSDLRQRLKPLEGQSLSQALNQVGQAIREGAITTKFAVTPLRINGDKVTVMVMFGSPDEATIQTPFGDMVLNRVATAPTIPPISTVEPVYPPLARQARVQGSVLIEALMTTEGKVDNIRVINVTHFNTGRNRSCESMGVSGPGGSDSNQCHREFFIGAIIRDIFGAQRTMKTLSLSIAAMIISCVLRTEQASAQARTIDESVPAGSNYDKAEFRLWMPENAGSLRAAVILVPGSNGDGRAEAQNAGWQAFATKNHLALVGCRFTDIPHDQGFIEEYAAASRGSGQALETALRSFGERSAHRELPSIPLLLWGMSAGGEFNYEFVAWKPERVAAFVVNKGGIYYSALLSRASRDVPGILFIGGKDLESRISTITGLFAVNRRAGALWMLAEEPGAGHIVGRSLDVAKIFFEDVMSARLGDSSSLRPVLEKDGFVGDPQTKTFRPAGTSPLPEYSTSWLPTARIARAWQALETEKPFEP